MEAENVLSGVFSKYEAGPRELVKTEEGHKDVVMETGDLIDLGNSKWSYLERPEKTLLD